MGKKSDKVSSPQSPRSEESAEGSGEPTTEASGDAGAGDASSPDNVKIVVEESSDNKEQVSINVIKLKHGTNAIYSGKLVNIISKLSSMYYGKIICMIILNL